MSVADFRKKLEVKRYSGNTIKTYCSLTFHINENITSIFILMRAFKP